MKPLYPSVAHRANHRCEYCRAPEVVFNFPFEVEHIIPVSRQGTNDASNLALACHSCNRYKGNRVAALLDTVGKEIRLFHPRKDSWSEYFEAAASSGEITGKTGVDMVTAASLSINSKAQANARKLWIHLGLFP